MSQSVLVQRLFECLLKGDRPASRRIVDEAARTGLSPSAMITDVFWPTYEMAEGLYRQDQLGRLGHQLATRQLRVLVDQNFARLLAFGAGGKAGAGGSGSGGGVGRAGAASGTVEAIGGSGAGRTILAVCGPRDADELGAQMAVDLLEYAGFAVRFAGGNIANDEILADVHERTPDVLLLFASGPSDLPNIRQIIDTLGEINAHPRLQIAVGGGVFNRADGLAEEIGADVWALTPLEMVDVLIHDWDRRAVADQRTVGRKKKVRAEAA